jgi:hypothetical protein
MTTVGLDIAQVLNAVKGLNVERHLELVHEKISDKIGRNIFSLN